MILTIRSDKPEAELMLFNNDSQVAVLEWNAHRLLGETIHLKIAQILQSANAVLSDVEAIVLYKGPGSFTGLRIGASVANSLAYALDVPVCGETGDTWQQDGIKNLASSDCYSSSVRLMYGSAPHITQSKK